MSRIIVLSLAVLAVLCLPGCHDGSNNDSSPSPVPTVESNVHFLTIPLYPDGSRSLSMAPEYAELQATRCLLHMCSVAGVTYYGCPPELWDRGCQGAR